MIKLNLVKEKQEQILIQTAAYNQVVAKYYNKEFHPMTFKVGDLVLNKVLAQEPGLGSFGPK